MPFDPNLPATGSPLASAVMRSQLTSLKALIDAVPAGEVTNAQLAAAIQGTSNNSNSVATLDTAPNNPPTVDDYEMLRGKLNELILALRRNP